MIDDVFALSNCGPESRQINAYINIKTGCKKLQYAKEKTYKLHIGKEKDSFRCKNAYIDSWEEDLTNHSEQYSGKVKVKEIWSTKYLGEIISSDGKNTENISARKKRGFGTVNDIKNMLDKMCLGPYMFRKAIVLRDSMLVGTLLSCSEAWYNVSEAELGQIEQVDKSLWSSLLEVARTVPYDLLCLELGVEPLRFIIMRRRLVYLQHILKQNESSLVKQFLKTQSINPKKKDWVSTVNKDLEYLGIKLSFSEIEVMGKSTYKKLIKKKIREQAFLYLIEKVNNRDGKGKEIIYSKLYMQEYLTEEWENINNCERKLIFQLRTKMHFKVKSHFRNMHIDTVCDGCRIFQSTTKHTLECKSLIGQNELVTYIPTYEDIYENDVEEQIYIARIFRDNIRRLPDIGHIFIDED